MTTTLLMMTIALSLGPAAGAQDKPNFTGTWVVVSPERSAGDEETITHDGVTLVRRHDSAGGGHSFTYQLDGSETRNVLTPHPGEELVIQTRAQWEGSTVVIKEMATYPDGRKREVTSRWRLDEKGQLHVDADISVDGKPQPTTKTIYRKKD